MPTIRVSDDVRDRLEEHGEFMDSFDDVVGRVLDLYEADLRGEARLDAEGNLPLETDRGERPVRYAVEFLDEN